MGDRLATAIWLGDYRVDVSSVPFSMRVDEPERVGGSGTGPQPTDLLLASIASCMTLSVAYSAKKRDVPVQRLSVAVTGTYQGPRFSEIDIHVSADCSPDQLEQLVASAKRVCYVTNTIQNPPEFTITHEAATG